MQRSDSRHREERHRRSDPASAQAALDCFADARDDEAQTRSRGAFALLLPACGEKVGMRGRCRLAQHNGHAPSPAPSARPLPRAAEMKESSCAQTDKFVLATLSCARALLHHNASTNLSPQEGAERRTCDFSAIDERVNCTHMRLQVETLDDALLQLYPELLLRGNHVAASRGENTEILGVLIEIERPRARLSRSETLRKGV